MGDIVITPASNDVNSTAGTLNIRTSDSYPMLLKTSNVERISITAAGLVGIGTTAPTGKLHIYSSITGDTLIRADGTNGTIFSVTDDLSNSLLSVNNSAGLPVLEVFADDSVVMGQYGSGDLVVKNNEVGIGTTNPINKLSVIGNASIGSAGYNVNAPSNGLIVEGTVGIGITNPNSNYKLDLSSSNDGYARQWIASTAFVGTDNGTNGFQIRVLGGGTNGLKISNSVNNVEYVRISSDGKVGIGTIAPTGFLTIQGNSNQLRLQTADGPGSFYTYISSLYDSSHPFSISVANNNTNTSEFFGVYADAGGANNRIALLNGNVGIGTTVPTGLLNVTRNSNTAQPIASFRELFGTPPATNILLLERGNNLTAVNQISLNAGLRIRDHSSNYSLSIEDHNSNVNFAISGTRVLVGSRGTNSLLNVGGAGSIAPSSGITFGGDAQANLYRVGEDSIQTDGNLYVAGTTVLQGDKYLTTLKSVFLVARGAGLNNNASRYLAINNNAIYNNTSRGLRLTIINATNLAVVSNTDYDTVGSDAACDDLATAINGMTSQQIGVLTSYDAWERDRASLRAAALNVGLTKLGTYSTGGTVRKPYAAVFNGTSDTANATTKHVIERMESSDADATRALITTYLTTDGTYASIDAALHMPNALYASDADIEYPIVAVNSVGNVGIGTTAAGTKLEVYGVLRVTESSSGGILQLSAGASNVDIASTFYGGSRRPITFTVDSERVRIDAAGRVGIGTNNPVAYLHVTGQTFLNNVVASTARNQLTINTNGANYAHFYDVGVSANNALAIGGNGAIGTVPTKAIMSWRLSTENVGIGLTNPEATSALHIKNLDAAAKVTIESADASESYINFSAQSSEYSVGFVRDGSNVNSLRFCAADSLSANEVMRLQNTNVGIGLTNPTEKLHVTGYILTRSRLAYTQRNDVVKNGLSFYVDFNNKTCFDPVISTSSIKDISNNNYALTLVNAATVSNKDGNTALYTANNSSYLQIASYVMALPHTWEAWVNGDAFGTGGSGWDTIWDSGGLGIERPLIGTINGVLNVYPNTNNCGTLTAGKWYHIVVTTDASSNIVTYINGVQTASFAYVSTFNVGTGAIWLGGDNSVETFNGYIPIARTYNRVLSATEVMQNYNAEKWRFDNSSTFYHNVADGTVGLSTTTPSHKLHVYARGNGAGILIESDPTDNANQAPALKLYPKSTSANERSWSISPFRNYAQSLSISSSDSKGGDPYSNATTRLIIDGINGNVGIGTINPTQKLDIVGSYAAPDDDAGILKIRGAGVGPTQLNFGVSADGGYGWIQATDIAVSNDKNIILNPLDGNVGIGTTNPLSLLGVGAAGSTTAANGLTFGQDAQANLYRVAEDTIRTDGSFIAVGNLTVGNSITASSEYRMGLYLGYVATFPSIATAAYRWIILGPYNDTLTVAGNGLRVRGELFFSRGSNGENLRNARLKVCIGQGYNKDLLHADVLSIDSDSTTEQPILYSVYLNGFTSKYFAIDAAQLVSFSPSSLDAATVYYNGQFYDQSNDARSLTIQANASITGAIGVVSKGGKIANALFAHTGNIGIGISVPSAKLEVNGPVFIPSTNGLYLGGTAGSFNSWHSVQYANNGYHVISSNGLVINNAGYSASPINAFTILTNTYDVGLSTNAPAERLHVYKTGLANNSTNSLLLLDGKFTAASVDSNDIVGIAFRVENAAGSSQRTTSIASSYQGGGYNALLLQHQGGNVGIGTINPTYKTDIAGPTSYDITTDSATVLRVRSTSSRYPTFPGETTAIALTKTNEPYGWRLLSQYVADTYAGADFHIQNSLDITPTWGSKLTILRDGKVGINITNPTYTLQVAGTFYVNSTSFFNGAVTVEDSLTVDGRLNGSDGVALLKMRAGNSAGAWNDVNLQYEKNSSADSLHFNMGDTTISNASVRLTVQNNGNIGIGTTRPGGLLHVFNTTGRYINYVPGSVSGLVIQKNASISSQGTTVLTLANAQGMESLVDRGTSLNLDIGYGGSTTVGGTIARGARIAALNHNIYDATAANQNAYLAFYTATGGSLTEKLRIHGDGKVGIGTASPYSLLDVQVASASPRYVTISTNDGQGSYYGFGLNFRIANNSHDIGQIRGVYENSNGGGYGGLAIATRFAGTLYDRVTFTDQGRVGIGMTNPTTLLSVGGAGSATAASGITFGADSVANLYRISASRLKTDGFLTIDGGGGGATNLLLNRSSSSNENGMAFTTAGSVDWYYYVDNATTNLQIQKGNELDSAPRVRFNGANSDILFNLGGGNIGVGTATPTGKLHIYSTITGQTLLRADGTNGTIFSVIDDLSNSLLSVNNSAGIPVLEVFADDSIVMGQYGVNDFVLLNNKIGLGTNNPQYELDIVGAGTNAAVNIITRMRSTAGSNVFDTASVIAFTNTTTNSNAYSYIGSRIDLGGAGDNGQSLVFATNTTNTLPTEKMRIKSDGSVGIGLTNPTYRLQVSGGDVNIASANVLRFGTVAVLNEASNANDIYANIRVIRNYSSVNQDGMYINYDSQGATTAHLRFYANAGNERMRIDASNGNVGIGVTNPTARLQVANTGTITSIATIRIVGSTGNNAGSQVEFYKAQTAKAAVGLASAVVGGGTSDDLLLLSANPASIVFNAGANGLAAFKSDGNVGIGLTNPAAARLHIKGNGTAPVLRVETAQLVGAAGGTAGKTFVGWMPIQTGAANPGDTVFIPLYK